MPKLIVQDGDKKRAFRLSKGRLTLGSAASNKLVLESSGVAAEHAVLVVRDDGTFVDALAPLEIDGQKVSGNGIGVALGSSIRVGGAVLSLQADTADAAPAAASAEAPAAAKPATRASAGSASKSRATRGRASARETEKAAERPGRRGAKKAEKKAWVMPLIIGLAFVILGVAISLMTGGNNRDLINQAIYDVSTGNIKSARALYDSFDEAKLGPDETTLYAELKTKLETAENEALVGPQRSKALKWVDTYLVGYRQRYLGEANLAKDPPEVQAAKKRLWLIRYADMERRFPDHASADWLKNGAWAARLTDVQATKAEYMAVADATRAPTLADLDWAIWYYTDPVAKSGRRFDLARAELDRFASGGGSGSAVEERRALLDERAVNYANAQMDLANRFFEAGRNQGGENNEHYNKSAACLIEVAMVTGVGSKASEALEMLGKFPNLGLIMQSYASVESRDESAAEKLEFLERAGPAFVQAIGSAREVIKAREEERAARAAS